MTGTRLLLEMAGGRVYTVPVPDGYSIEASTSRRGLLSTPVGSFATSEIVSATLDTEVRVSLNLDAGPGRSDSFGAPTHMGGRRGALTP